MYKETLQIPWLKVALAGGALLAVALLLQTFINYRYVSNNLIEQDARRTAEERLRNVERSARLSRPQDAAAFQLLLDDIREDWPEQVAGMALIAADGVTLAASGPGAPLAATAVMSGSTLQRTAPGSRVITKGRLEGRGVFLTAYPCRCGLARRGTGDGQSPDQPALRLHLALYEDSLSAPFARLRRNAIVSASAALALLVALGIIALRAGAYVRGKQLEAQMQVARDVQLDLLPSADAIPPGVDLAAVCHSASEIGGDFYDVASLPGGGVAVVIGDVSGHGVSAALLMGLIHGVMTHTPWSQAADPALEAARLNDVLLVKSSGERYASLFWCKFEPVTGELRYVNAGHLPPLLLRSGGAGRPSVERLSEGGPVLGLLPTAKYQTTSVRAGAGDLLVLFSDGITEAPDSRGAQFGEDQLLAAAEAHADEPARAICDAIFDAVRQFAGGRPSPDDQTLVVLRLP